MPTILTDDPDFKSARYASTAGLILVAAIGDSRSANGRAISGNEVYRNMHGVASWLGFLSKGKVKAPGSYNLAVSSSTMTSISPLGIIPSDGSPGQLAQLLALPARPTHCHILTITNDIAAGATIASLKTSLTTIWSTLLANGIVPVMQLDLPRVWGSAALRRIHFAINAWITRMAQSYGIVVLDATPYLANMSNANGEPISSLYYDTTLHPGNNGAYQAAQPWVSYLNALVGAPGFHGFSQGDVFDATDNPGGNLMPGGGIFAGTAGAVSGTNVSGTVATGFTVELASGAVTSCVCSLEARSDGGAGWWQKLEITASAAFNLRLRPTTNIAVGGAGNIQVGDKIDFGIDLDVFNQSGLTNFTHRILENNGGSTIGTYYALAMDQNGGGKGPLPAAFAGRSQMDDDMTIIASTTQLLPYLTVASAGAATVTIKAGAWELRKPVA